MKIEQITVHAGQTIPHPTIQFSNLKAGLTYAVSLDSEDDAEKVRVDLQEKVTRDVAVHLENLQASIRLQEEIDQKRSELAALERTNNQNTQRADELRDWLDSHSRPLLAVEGASHDE